MDRERIAMRVSVIGIAINAALSALKLAAGILGRSSAMVSDAAHSLSDIFSTFVVMIGIKLAAKQSDEDHPYGHERMECAAAIVLSVFLAFAGLGIGYAALQTIMRGQAETPPIPSVFPLVCAVVSIAVKEGLYHYTRIEAKRINSGALMADAWHHRSDALSSIGSLIGIAGARMGYPILDPIAGFVICVFILKAAFDVFRDAVGKMTDRAVDRETLRSITGLIKLQKDVIDVDMIKTRIFGDKVYVDVEIITNGEHSLKRAHDAAQAVHDAIEAAFPQVKHIMVHMNPSEEGWN